MTISTTTVSAGPYTGNGTTGPHPFTFPVADYGAVEAEDQIEVVLVTIATGAETVLTRGTAAGQYSVSVNEDQEASPGGSVSTITSYSSAYKIYIRAAPNYLQATDLPNQGAYRPETVEAQFDQVARQVLDIRDRQTRGPYFGVQAGAGFDGKITGELTAGHSIIVNGAETGFTTGVPAAGATVSAAMIPVVTSSTIALAAALQGVPANLKAFLAAGDGTTNDDAAVAALELAHQGAMVDGAGLTYLVTSIPTDARYFNGFWKVGSTITDMGPKRTHPIDGGSVVVTDGETQQNWIGPVGHFQSATKDYLVRTRIPQYRHEMGIGAPLIMEISRDGGANWGETRTLYSNDLYEPRGLVGGMKIGRAHV